MVNTIRTTEESLVIKGINPRTISEADKDHLHEQNKKSIDTLLSLKAELLKIKDLHSRITQLVLKSEDSVLLSTAVKTGNIFTVEDCIKRIENQFAADLETEKAFCEY